MTRTHALPPKQAYLYRGVPMGHEAGLTIPWLAYRGTSLIRKDPAPQNHHRALGIALL